MIIDINSQYRIESDRYQWTIKRRRGEGWEAKKYYRHLATAAKWMLEYGFATAEEIGPLKSAMLAISAAEQEIDSLLRELGDRSAILPQRGKDLAIDDHWIIAANEYKFGGFNLVRMETTKPDDKSRDRYGTYRTLAAALTDAIHYRIRVTDSLKMTERICRESIAAAKASAAAGNARLTPVISEPKAET